MKVEDFIIEDMSKYIKEKIGIVEYKLERFIERDVKAVSSNGIIVGVIPADFLTKREEDCFIGLVEHYLYLKEQLKRFEK